MPTTNLADAIRFIRWLGQKTPAVYTLGTELWPVYRTDGKTSLQDILNENQNTYFSPAQTISGLKKKALKTELVSTCFVHVDMDPIDGQDPVKEQDRLYTLVSDGRPSAVPAPSCVIASGRGVQCLWRLKHPIALPEGQDTVEQVNLWLMEQLLAPAGTHNVDRILRLPGSWNALDAKKIAKGYQPRQAQLIEINDLTYTLEDFGKGRSHQQDHSHAAPRTSTPHSGSADDIEDEVIPVKDLGKYEKLPLRIKWLIAYGTPSHDLNEYERDFGPLNGRDPADRSAWLYDVGCQMLRCGISKGEILGIFTDSAWGISGHCLDQKDPDRAARRQLARALKTVEQDAPPSDPDPPRPSRKARVSDANAVLDDDTDPKGDEDFICDPKTNIPFKSTRNALIALCRLDVKLTHDMFKDANLLNGAPIQDPDVLALWFRIEALWGFTLGIEKFTALMQNQCRKHAFHPVKDYLGALEWDRVPRLDTWLTRYGRVPDSPYTRAVGALPIIAAARRIYQPGAMFQEVLTFISSDQGTEKSSAIKSICPKEEWFSDDLPLNAEAQQVIERLQGHLIIECAETKGMKQGGDEHVKAFLSRNIDMARMAYGRIVKRAPRQCVFMATSNDEAFLRDPTGNRRWWPVTIRPFDIDALVKDRDQIWAEAVYREQQGESIRLHPSLYGAAAEEQAQRTMEHPFVDILNRALGDKWGKILAADAWDLLGVSLPKTQETNSQLRHAMVKLGWAKDRQRFDGALQTCYTKGHNDGSGGTYPGHKGQQIVVSKRQDGRPIAAYLDEGPSDQAF